MNILAIALLVVLFIFFLLLLPLTVHISFEKKLSVTCKYLFIEYKVFPKKEKPKSKKVKKSTTKKSNKEKQPKKENPLSRLREVIEQTGLDGFLEILKNIAVFSKEFTVSVLKHTVVKILNIDIEVTGEDASDCAINYGYVCSVVYPACGFFLNNVKDYKTLNVVVLPEFDKTESKVKASMLFYVPLIWVLVFAIVLLFNASKELIKYNLTKKEMEQSNTVSTTNNATNAN